MNEVLLDTMAIAAFTVTIMGGVLLAVLLFYGIYRLLASIWERTSNAAKHTKEYLRCGMALSCTKKTWPGGTDTSVSASKSASGASTGGKLWRRQTMTNEEAIKWTKWCISKDKECIQKTIERGFPAGRNSGNIGVLRVCFKIFAIYFCAYR